MFDVYKEHKLLKPQLKIQRVVLSRKTSISPKTSQFTMKPLKENEKSNMRGKSMPELRRSKSQQKTDGLESENNSSKKTHNTKLKSVKKLIKNRVNGIEELNGPEENSPIIKKSASIKKPMPDEKRCLLVSVEDISSKSKTSLNQEVERSHTKEKVPKGKEADLLDANISRKEKIIPENESTPKIIFSAQEGSFTTMETDSLFDQNISTSKTNISSLQGDNSIPLKTSKEVCIRAEESNLMAENRKLLGLHNKDSIFSRYEEIQIS